MDPYLLTVSPTKPWIRYSFFTDVLSIHAGLVIWSWVRKIRSNYAQEIYLSQYPSTESSELSCN